MTTVTRRSRGLIALIAVAALSAIAASAMASARMRPLNPETTPQQETGRQETAAQEPAPGMLRFDFQDPKGVNALGFMLDSVVEPFFGTGTNIAGAIDIDPADPRKTTGTLTMRTMNVQMTNPAMTSVLHNSEWLDVANYPQISLVVEKVTAVRTIAENVHELDVEVSLLIRDVTRRLPIKVTATYLPGRLGDRLRGMKGDLLILRSTFAIRRADFGIKPEMNGDVVAEEIQVRAAIAGYRATE